MKHAPWQYYNISYNSTNNAGDESQSCNIYNSTNYAGDELQSCNISCNNTNNAVDVSQSYNISCKPTNNIGSVSGCTIEELPYYNKYCFTITPINYYGSGMQLICKLLSLYINFVLFIGGCVPGYNVKPPIISDTTFDSSGVTLHWEDPENTCNSTEYLIILYNITNDTCNYYSCRSTTNKNLIINSKELSLTANYAYKIEVMGRQESNISDRFTLGKSLVKCLIAYIPYYSYCRSELYTR